MESAEKGVVIEMARPEDARDIQDVFYRSWLKTYPSEEYGITAADIKENFKDAFTEETLEKRRLRFSNPDGKEPWLVARVDSKVVGLSCPVLKPDRNQLQRIYIHPDFQHHGIGTQLWQESKKYFDPMKETYVEVAIYNTQAIHFYEKLGFVDTGRRSVHTLFKTKQGISIPVQEMILKRL